MCLVAEGWIRRKDVFLFTKVRLFGASSQVQELTVYFIPLPHAEWNVNKSTVILDI